MHYSLENLPLRGLIAPIAHATAVLARLDERVARSPVGSGWIERSHFSDAVASLWIDGELVHLEDLVLHDAAMGIRAPTHELTIAHEILRTRRRMVDHEKGWSLSTEGLQQLRGRSAGAHAPLISTEKPPRDESEGDDISSDPFSDYLADMDAVLAKSEAAISRALAPDERPRPAERDPLLYEPDWDEDERLDEWRSVVAGTAGLPAILRAAVALDAWNQFQVLQHAPWMGRLLAAELLRSDDVTLGHLAAVNVGLRQVTRDRRTARDRATRILALIEAMGAAAEAGLREHDRLMLARRQMEHRLVGRRQSSKLPGLIDLVLSRPMVSSAMIAKALSVTPQGALKIAADLNLRELTGRGRFRAWGIV